MIVPARSHVLFLTAIFQPFQDKDYPPGIDHISFSQPANVQSMIFRTSRERWDTVDGRDPANQWIHSLSLYLQGTLIHPRWLAGLRPPTVSWLVVSTPLKNMSQIGNLPQIGVKIQHILVATT